eukprot:CAMPEP_0170175034 /NCGR_PEP_ID=MMETSP0040_2-20121228/8183_1 /TAXON_ID=641309 /ORGANISM="Lotharella oceanica, Strain CCMP622" /LENGTH=298 /DNA_ID=CAMNT_0010416885 /DNA_START=228 /DNA_END=1121 /DNA_ORIENTATION=-
MWPFSSLDNSKSNRNNNNTRVPTVASHEQLSPLERSTQGCVSHVCSFLDPVSVCRLSEVNSRLNGRVTDAVWRDQVTRVCEQTLKSELEERRRLAEAGSRYMWMRSMPEITRVALSDLHSHVRTSKRMYKSSSSTTIAAAKAKSSSPPPPTPNPPPPTPNSPPPPPPPPSSPPPRPAREGKQSEREQLYIGLGDTSWYWKHERRRVEARMGVGMPCMQEYYTLQRANDWLTRARVLCGRDKWCVILFYDERVSAGYAINQIHAATGRSTLGSLWSALRIGNPLFGGNQSEGEIFWGTW